MSAQGSLWSKAQSVLEVATKLTIVGVPALYFAGWNYLDTYWSDFGVADQLMGYTSTDYIRSGALVLVLAFIGSTGWVAIITWVVVPLVIIMMVIRVLAMPMLFGASRRLKAFKAKLRRQGCVTPRHLALARSIDAALDAVNAGILSFLLSFLLVFGLIYVGVRLSATQAKADAEKERTALTKIATLERNWMLGYTEAESARPALVIGCGSEMCVLLRDEKTDVIPRSTVTRMETCRRISKADDGTLACTARTDML
jgi:hypothetical protein